MDLLHSQITAKEFDFFCFSCCDTDGCGRSGEVLRGDRIVNTAYQVQMHRDKKCELVCPKTGQPTKLSVANSKLIAERIQEEYYIHL